MPAGRGGGVIAHSDVAVVVPTRDRPEMLRRSLAALRAQTPPGVELIVVDSASVTGATRAEASAAGVRYVRVEQPGVSIARNAGVEATDRAIVVFTDDDCRVVEGWIDALVAHFGDPAVGAVAGRLVDHTLVGTASDRPSPVVRLDRIPRGLDAGHGAVMAFRRGTLQEEGGFDAVLGAGRLLAGADDADMFCRVIAAGGVVVSESAAVVHHVHTRDDTAYVDLRRGYGLGLGALVAKWIRLRPAVGIRMLVTLVGRGVIRWVRHRSNPRRRAGERAAMSGLVRGAVIGWRTPLRGGVFVDER